jgi:hypothetical protein
MAISLASAAGLGSGLFFDPLPGLAAANSRWASAAPRSVSALQGGVSVPEPVDVRTSDAEPDTNGWGAVDGNLDTFWQGQTGAQGWWLALTYGKDVQAQDV